MRRWIAALGLVALAARGARASVVERIVAVVGERPILLSELRHRARPNLLAMYLQTPNPAQQSVEEQKIYRDVLEHMIDEQLIEQAAQKAHLAISVDDIDKAIAKKASEMGIAPKDLVAEARREGLSEQDYRDEIRRQLLEGKVVQLRLANRIHVSESDAHATYDAFVKQFNAQRPIEVHILAIQIPAGAGQQDIDKLDKLAQTVVQQVRAVEGTEARLKRFCELLAQHTSVPASVQTCGARVAPFTQLPPVVQEQIDVVQDNDVTAPIRFGQTEIDIIYRTRFVPLAPFEQVKERMFDAAGNEAALRLRDQYLKELRRGVYVEVRLNA